jgi:hypothetical protein
MDKHEKINLKKNDLKNIDLKIKRTKSDTKKKNQIIRDEIRKIISIKKRTRTTKNNNQNNEDHI